MITDAENSLLNYPSMGCLVSISTVKINSNSFLWALHFVQAAHSTISRHWRYCVLSHCDACTHAITIDYWVTWDYASSNAV